MSYDRIEQKKGFSMSRLRIPNIHVMIYDYPDKVGQRAGFIFFISDDVHVDTSYFILVDENISLIQNAVSKVPQSDDFERIIREEFEQPLLNLKTNSFMKELFGRYSVSVRGISLIKHFFIEGDWKTDFSNMRELDVLDKYLKIADSRWSRNYASRKGSFYFHQQQS